MVYINSYNKTNEDKEKINKKLLEYIRIIGDEYPWSSEKISIALSRIQQREELAVFNPKDTITFIVKEGKLYLPQASYQIFKELEKNKKYGIRRNTPKEPRNYLDTNTTYIEYIDHIIEDALSVYDYFEESLLHEAMHICGSQGGIPLEEGINELKTRELAEKRNIKIAAYGYSKEVEIAKKLQEILGKDLLDVLTFIPKEKQYEFLLSRVGKEQADLYKLISNKMIEKSRNYFSKVFEVSDPYEKARLYETIDYSEIINILEDHISHKKKLY